jgi:DNA-binding MarR family transcriptional regulator
LEAKARRSPLTGAAMIDDRLRLGNQICFPIYAASRLFTRAYQPHLDALGITYPQYLVMMVLWEVDEASVGAIAERLLLNTNTITPLLKRMEVQGLIERQRSEADERRVLVHLTERGRALQVEAVTIPERFVAELVSDSAGLEDLTRLRDTLTTIIDRLSPPPSPGTT